MANAVAAKSTLVRQKQLALPLPSSWGGRRKGAGRKAAPGPGRVAHRARPAHRAAHPVHVTLSSKLSSLRSQFVFPTLRLAIGSLRRARSNPFRIVHFSVQSNHIHLIVEAESRAALSSGLRSLVVRIALQVNRLLMRRGTFWADRWHGRALTSPRAVRRVLVYVLANFRKHQPKCPALLDPCSSARYFDGYADLARAPPGAGATLEVDSPPVFPPRTWLLATGWKRHGLIATSERPAS